MGTWLSKSVIKFGRCEEVKKTEKFFVFLVFVLCISGGIFAVNTAYKNIRSLAFDDNEAIVCFYKNDEKETMLKFYDSRYNLSGLENKAEELLGKAMDGFKSLKDNIYSIR